MFATLWDHPCDASRKKWNWGASIGGDRKKIYTAPFLLSAATQESGMLWVRTTQASLQFIIL